MKVECSVPEGREFNTPYDIDDLIPDAPYTEKEISDVVKNEIEKLEKQKQKISSSDSSGKRTGMAIQEIDKQIKKLRDENNTITY